MPSDTPKHDLKPSANSFPKKTRGQSFDEAMNAPNTPRPMSDEPYESPKDAQGFHNREKESYNVTYDYCDEESNDRDY